MSRSLDILSNEYFNWMYNLVCDSKYSKRSSYRKLLSYLHNREFTYILEMDGNRAEDGKELRYRFLYENGYHNSEMGDYLDDGPCSVLEMMVALVIRCEEHIMDDPEIGNRTGQWFWSMIVNLGLESMSDRYFDEEYVEMVVDRLLNREYDDDGRGGLFTVTHYRQDMRDVDIWYQFMWYLDEI